MGNAVGRTDGKSTVEHASDEDESVTAVASAVLPILPHKVVGCMSDAVNRRHHGAHDDNDYNAGNDQEAA